MSALTTYQRPCAAREIARALGRYTPELADQSGMKPELSFPRTAAPYNAPSCLGRGISNGEPMGLLKLRPGIVLTFRQKQSAALTGPAEVALNWVLDPARALVLPNRYEGVTHDLLIDAEPSTCLNNAVPTLRAHLFNTTPLAFFPGIAGSAIGLDAAGGRECLLPNPSRPGDHPTQTTLSTAR